MPARVRQAFQPDLNSLKGRLESLTYVVAGGYQVQDNADSHLPFLSGVTSPSFVIA